VQTHNSLKIGTLVRWVPLSHVPGAGAIPELGIVIQLPRRADPTTTCGCYCIAWTISKPSTFSPRMVDQSLQKQYMEIVG